MSRRKGGRIAVYVVVTSPEFKPQRAWHVPEGFADGVLYARNLLTGEAKCLARAFNDRALLQKQCSGWDRKWAIVSAYLRPKWQESTNNNRRAAAGGAA